MVKHNDSTILKISAQGYVLNPEIYGSIYKSFIDKNRDEQGNILDDTKEQELCKALREQLEKLNKHDLAYCIEQLITYEKFGGNPDLMKFIDVAKRFVVAVEKEPQRLYEFLPHYDKIAKLNMLCGGLSMQMKAQLVHTIEGYILNIQGGLK